MIFFEISVYFIFDIGVGFVVYFVENSNEYF